MSSSQSNPRDDRTPLMLAASADDAGTVMELILERALVDEKDQNGWSALMYAADHNSLEAVRQLLDSGANPDVHRSYEMIDTPSSLAAANGHFDMVRLLVAFGADPSPRAWGNLAVLARLGGPMKRVWRTEGDGDGFRNCGEFFMTPGQDTPKVGRHG